MNSKKNIAFLLAAATLLGISCSRASGPRTLDGKTVEPFVYGVYGIYDENIPEASIAPEGYEPVYLSHYGRHGSRYIMRDTQYTFVAQVLQKAHDDGKLTPLGESAYERYMRIYPQLEGKAQDITPIGEQQHRNIASRMYERYGEIFAGDSIIAYSTDLQRTIKSMEAFIGTLENKDSCLRIHSEATKAEMYYLNPQSQENPRANAADLLWKSEKAPWRPEYDEYCRQHTDWRSFAGRIFSDMDYAQKLCRIDNLEKDIYYISIHLPGLPVEQVGFFDLFTSEELSNIAEFGENYVLYVRAGHYPKADGRGWALAESLLNDFIVKTDCDLEAGTPKLRLRFGHDGCIMSLFALMDLPGWNGSESDPAHFKDVWDISKVTMASNIQFVLYRSKTDFNDLIFKMMYNEQDMELPLAEIASKNGHYYRWNDFKAYCEPKIAEARQILDETSI